MFARNMTGTKIKELIAMTGSACMLAGTMALCQETESNTEDPLAMPDMVVTAARTETLKETVGGSLTIITKEDIQRRKPKNMGDLLRLVPGLHVRNQGGRGNLTSVSIRGAASDNVLVLIDGVRANSATAGGFDFGSLEPSNIERIEVLRGPQNTLYGADASAGVISIITQGGETGFHGDISVEAGTENYHQERLRLRTGTDRLKYSFAVEHSRTDSVSAAWDPAGNKETDDYNNITLSQRLNWELFDDGHLDLSYRHSRGESDLDAGPETDDPNYRQRTTGHYGNAKYTQTLASWWRQSLRYGRATEEYLSRDPDVAWRNSEIHTDVQQAGTQADFFLGENDTLSLGYEHEVRDGEVVDVYQEDYELKSGYLENQLTINQAIHLTVGSRYDDFADFGNAWTGRGSFVWKMAATRFHGSIGNGFRVPDLNDLLWPVDPLFGGGNPDLEPERSVGGDVGIEQGLFDEKLLIDVTYFENKYRNLIEWQNTDPLNPWFYQPVNLEKVRTKGTETTLTWLVTDTLRFNGSHTYTDTEDLADGSRLARRPLNKYTAEAAFELGPKLSGSLAMVAVHDRIDTNGDEMDDYERWDLALTYQVHENLKTYLRIENLFDANYQEITGYTSPGISGFAGVSLLW